MSMLKLCIALAAVPTSAMYLQSLENGVRLPSSAPQTAPSHSVAAPPVAVDADRRAVIGSSRWVTHAPPSYFLQDKLAVKGVRANCDVGEPVDATRPLVKVGAVAAGAWSCTAGGWPSPNPRTSTETFYVLEGEGSVVDEDGTRHRFGAGDLVVLPQGCRGRWDVHADIRKIWNVHTHDAIPGASTIPVVMTPAASSGGKVFGNGLTTIDVYTAPPGSTEVADSPTEVLFVLEGAAFVTNVDGSAIRCLAGDTVVLPEGWSGRWDVIESLKAVRTSVRQS